MHDRHHRLPRSRFPAGYEGSKARTPGGRRNIVTVDIKIHALFHRMFGNMTAPEIASMLTDAWINPDQRMVVQNKRRGER